MCFSHTPLIENSDKTKMKDKENDRKQPEGFFFSPMLCVCMFPNGFCKDNRPSQLYLAFSNCFGVSNCNFSVSVFYLRYRFFFTLYFRDREKKKSKANNIMHVERRRLFKTVLTSYKTGNFSLRHFAWQPLPVDSER